MRITAKKTPEVKNTLEVLLTLFLPRTYGRLTYKNGKLNA
jgi:hypothetical protein